MNFATATSEAPPIESPGGFEMVLGPLQIASLSFVILVVLVLGCGVAYTVGRSTSRPIEIAATEDKPKLKNPAPLQPAVSSTPSPSASVGAEAGPLSADDANAPLFGNPLKGQLYIQMSAIDRGMSIVFAEGLRKLGFQSLIAPGANDHIFRVIVGPFPSSAEFSKAKAALSAIGLDTFGRRYDASDTKSTPKASGENTIPPSLRPSIPDGTPAPQPDGRAGK